MHPVTLAIARLAGRIEGQQEAMGVQFAFEDLLIGATALHLGYEVATLKVRPYQSPAGVQEYERDQGWTVGRDGGRPVKGQASSPSFLSSQAMLE